VVREVREETGLDVVAERVVGVFGGSECRHRYPNGDETEYVVVVFDCAVKGGTLMSLDGESLELRYFRAREAPALAAGYPRDLLLTPPGSPTRFDAGR
jgi:8-oxo-dGTP pyrophosphatase MutT (NUDIX family)